MPHRLIPAFACLLALLALAPAALASPRMFVGAAEDAARGDLIWAKAKMDLARLAGFDAIRVTSVWNPGERKPSDGELLQLQNAAQAADLDGIRLLITVMPYGSATTPLTAKARRDFASYAAALVAALPTVHDFIIGNEPNLNRYWLPQFGAGGGDAAAPAYEQLLATTYDAMKAVDSTVTVIGGSLSPRGGDDPSSSRQTHSPTVFIADLGAAYRLSGRTRPIMDALALHPYGESSKIPPTLAHPLNTSIGLADYRKLVALLGAAFNGTAQPGSALPIIYDEYGVQSKIPAAKTGAYTNLNAPAAQDAVDESVQGAYYRQALLMAACQPTVEGFLIFHVSDEADLDRWQSGLFYPDDTPKSDLGLVRQTIRQLPQVDCGTNMPASFAIGSAQLKAVWRMVHATGQLLTSTG